LPFVLTVLVGVPLLHSAARDARPLHAAVKLGAALPVAYAPFVSITGDYYEMGSILVSRLVHTIVPSLPLDRWRSDDLFKLISEISGGGGLSDAAGIGASFLVGVVLIFATYAAGVAVAQRFVRTPDVGC
jgi:hypothetical protein